MMEILLRKQLKLLALHYFLKLVPSKMFGTVLNTPLSYYDSICNYNTNDNTALLNSKTQVK